MSNQGTHSKETTAVSINGINADTATLPSGIELEGNVSIESIDIETEARPVTEVESGPTHDGSPNNGTQPASNNPEPVTDKECRECGTVFNMREVGRTFDGTTARYQCPSCGTWNIGPMVTDRNEEDEE